MTATALRKLTLALAITSGVVFLVAGYQVFADSSFLPTLIFGFFIGCAALAVRARADRAASASDA